MVEEYRNYHGKYLLTLVFASTFLFSFGILVQNAFADQVVATIPMVDSSTGNSGLAGFSTVNPNTDMIYVAVQVIPFGGATPYGWVAVINGSTNTVVNEVPLKGVPGGIAANPDTNRIYVVDGAGLEVIDGTSNSIVATIPISCAGFVAVNPNTNEVYVAKSIGGASVCVINGTDNSQVAYISVAADPDGIGINPVTNKIYVASQGLQSSVAVINGSTHTVIKTIPAAGYAQLVGVNPDTNKIYVSTGSVGVTYLINGSNDIATKIPLSVGCFGVIPKADKIYACDGNNSNQIDVVNGTTDTITSTIQISSGLTPYLVANPDTERIYVSSPSYPYTVIVIQGGSSSPTFPSTPTGLIATAISSSQINLSWTAPSNNGGSAIIGYKIERTTDSGSTWSTLTPNTGSTTTTYNDTGLAVNTTYTYRVSAINSVGTSMPSNTAAATTQQAPLSVAVLTNKQSYPQNSTVYVAVVVKSNSTPTSGASITLHVCNPNNGCMTGTGTTNSNGNAIFRLAIPPNALTGTYTVDATVSKSGYVSGTGKTTFQVT